MPVLIDAVAIISAITHVQFMFRIAYAAAMKRIFIPTSVYVMEE
jgi:hypothetical protein